MKSSRALKRRAVAMFSAALLVTAVAAGSADAHIVRAIVTPPQAGATYTQGQVVVASYGCLDSTTGHDVFQQHVTDCSMFNGDTNAPIANGGPVDTSTVGVHKIHFTDAESPACGIACVPGDSDNFTYTYNVIAPTVLTAEPLVAQALPAVGHGLISVLPLVRINLTYAATLKTSSGVPVAGKLIAFTGVGGNCVATTDATGRATCGTILQGVLSVLGLSYNAAFAGDGGYLASSAKGPLLTLGGSNI